MRSTANVKQPSVPETATLSRDACLRAAASSLGESQPRSLAMAIEDASPRCSFAGAAENNPSAAEPAVLVSWIHAVSGREPMERSTVL